jgi:RNA polymerase sigma-70 factor (ECF subfamily)
MTIPTDQRLVDAVLCGDRNSFAILVERYTGTVIAVTTEILRDKHAAEDVAQDAFVIAFERLQSLRDGAAFGYWLIRIARRAALRAARRQRRQRVLQVATRDGIASPKDQFSDRSQELLRLVQRLPEHERAVVMWKYFDGHSVHEISESTGQPVSTVTKKLTRARRRLELWLKESET